MENKLFYIVISFITLFVLFFVVDDIIDLIEE